LRSSFFVSPSPLPALRFSLFISRETKYALDPVGPHVEAGDPPGEHVEEHGDLVKRGGEREFEKSKGTTDG
jgi:hypothetical protein